MDANLSNSLSFTPPVCYLFLLCILTPYKKIYSFSKLSFLLLKYIAQSYIYYLKGYSTANSVTDIYYILNRSIKDKKKLYSVLDTLLKLVEIIDITSKDIKKAFSQKVKDLENELYVFVPNLQRLTLLLFVIVPAIIPEDFITKYFES